MNLAAIIDTASASFDRTYKTKNRIYLRRLALAKAVQKRKHVLFGTSGFSEDGHMGTHQRRDAWEEVRQELLRKGFSEFSGKTRLDIQKTDWQHVRRYVMDKRKIDSPARNEPITELDTVVFDIVKNFGRYSSTRDSLGDNNTDDHEMIMEDGQNDFPNRSNTTSPEHEFKSEENGADNLPPLSQLLNFQPSSPPQARSFSINHRTNILDVRLQREEYLRTQEKIKADILAEQLVQEQIRTKLLLSQLQKENPKMAEQFN